MLGSLRIYFALGLVAALTFSVLVAALLTRRMRAPIRKPSMIY